MPNVWFLVLIRLGSKPFECQVEPVRPELDRSHAPMVERRSMQLEARSRVGERCLIWVDGLDVVLAYPVVLEVLSYVLARQPQLCAG